MAAQVAADIRRIFNAPDRAAAEDLLRRTIEKYQPQASALARWMEENIPEGLTVFSFPEAQRRRLRTVNLLERVNQEVRRRTRIVRIFPNEEACLRLVSAVLMEIDENWQVGHKYLRFGEKEAASPLSL
jgi:transposase-like protein